MLFQFFPTKIPILVGFCFYGNLLYICRQTKTIIMNFENKTKEELEGLLDAHKKLLSTLLRTPRISKSKSILTYQLNIVNNIKEQLKVLNNTNLKTFDYVI